MLKLFSIIALLTGALARPSTVTTYASKLQGAAEAARAKCQGDATSSQCARAINDVDTAVYFLERAASNDSFTSMMLAINQSLTDALDADGEVSRLTNAMISMYSEAKKIKDADSRRLSEDRAECAGGKKWCKYQNRCTYLPECYDNGLYLDRSTHGLNRFFERRLSEFLKPNWSINRSGQGVRSFSGSATHIVDDDVAKVTPDGGSSWWFARDGNFLKEVTKEDGTLADNLVVGGNTLDVKPLVDQGFSFANRRLSEEESEDEPPTFMSLGYGVVINGASTTTAPVYQTSDCAKKVFVVASSLIHAGATTTCVSGCCA